jgi:hypothetical protein
LIPLGAIEDVQANVGEAQSFPGHGGYHVRLSAVAIVIGALIGLAMMVAFVRLLPRNAEEAGLGLNTQAVFHIHPRGRFHWQYVTAPELAEAARQFDEFRKLLWLGASQIYGINNYRPPQHNVAYRIFDASIDERAAVLTVSFPLASPEEHNVLLQHLIGKVRFSGLIIGAAFGDMRHAGLRQQIAQALDDPETRYRIEQTEQGQNLVAEAKPDRRPTPVARPEHSELSLTDRTERWITGRLEDWFGMENFRRAGRAWVLLGLQEMRRALESLRARYTRDLSRYRVPMMEQNYRTNWAAWQHMLATAKAEGIPALVYVAPRPTDFFPFDPETYDKFKRDLATLAAAHGANFVNIEDAVPNEHWGLVDIGFGFFARDPFHFTAEGHALMADALLPHIRHHLFSRAIGP